MIERKYIHDLLIKPPLFYTVAPFVGCGSSVSSSFTEILRMNAFTMITVYNLMHGYLNLILMLYKPLMDLIWVSIKY